MSSATIRSHWHHPVLNFKTSSQEFYSAIREALTPHNLPGVTCSTVDWKEGGLMSARREYFRIQREKLCFDVCAAPFGEDFFFSWWLTERPARFGLLRLFLILIGLWFVFALIAGFFTLLFRNSVLATIMSIPLAVITFIAVVWGLGHLLHTGAFGPGAEDAILGTPIIGWLYDKLFGPNTYYKIDTTFTFQSIIHSVVTDLVNARLNAKGMRPLTELEAKPVMHGLLAKSQHAGG